MGGGYRQKIYGFFAARVAAISFLRISLTIFPSTDPLTSLITTPISGPSAACPFWRTKSDRSAMIVCIIDSRSCTGDGWSEFLEHLFNGIFRMQVLVRDRVWPLLPPCRFRRHARLQDNLHRISSLLQHLPAGVLCMSKGW